MVKVKKNKFQSLTACIETFEARLASLLVSQLQLTDKQVRKRLCVLLNTLLFVCNINCNCLTDEETSRPRNV